MNFIYPFSTQSRKKIGRYSGSSPFCDTILQARQPINHRRVCVNNGMVNITHLKVSNGDRIYFQENDARICD